jgi:transcriptional regulator with XRE-family HTH domain
MRLQELREARGLSQLKLGEISGVAQSFINSIEAGRKSPTLRTLQKLANALEVEVTDLISTPKFSSQQKGDDTNERPSQINRTRRETA